MNRFEDGRFHPVPVENWRKVMELLGLDPDRLLGVTIRGPKDIGCEVWEQYATKGLGGWVMIVEEHTEGPQVLRSFVPIQLNEFQGNGGRD
jgi:hypothetical protein